MSLARCAFLCLERPGRGKSPSLPVSFILGWIKKPCCWAQKRDNFEATGLLSQLSSLNVKITSSKLHQKQYMHKLSGDPVFV
jgi:hypothetical protein